MRDGAKAKPTAEAADGLRRAAPTDNTPATSTPLPRLRCDLVGFLQNTRMRALRDLKSCEEPGAMVYLADCVELMRLMSASCVVGVFADPPYRLSGGGITVKSGRLASVDKGKWDRSLGKLRGGPQMERSLAPGGPARPQA